MLDIFYQIYNMAISTLIKEQQMTTQAEYKKNWVFDVIQRAEQIGVITTPLDIARCFKLSLSDSKKLIQIYKESK